MVTFKLICIVITLACGCFLTGVEYAELKGGENENEDDAE